MSFSPTLTENFPNPYLVDDDWVFSFTFLDGDDVAIDITGYTTKLYITKDGVDISGSPFTGTSNNLIGGEIDFVVLDSITSTLVAGNYKYEVEITNTTGINITYLRGNFTVENKY